MIRYFSKLPPWLTIRRRGMTLAGAAWAATAIGRAAPGVAAVPRDLASYPAAPNAGVFEILQQRITAEPFNLVATLIFLLAIGHTFLTAKFRHWAHVAEERHAVRRARRERPPASDTEPDEAPEEVSFKGQILHFLGEVEAVFGIWAVVLAGAVVYFFGWQAMLDYVGHRVNFTEPMFVVVIMALAGTRPVLRFAETSLRAIAALGGATTGAWWITLLTVAPILGSFITEPAAMTIGALLLARQFYARKPPARLAYATLGLLFVNVSVGGTLTHFAAPPVLMVAAAWHWGSAFMFMHFGWKAVLGIIVSTVVYYLVFRRELRALDRSGSDRAPKDGRQDEAPIPPWITAVHLLFMGFTVLVAHYPPLFIGAFLFFLAFAQATAHHQGKLDLRAPLLVGFFLAGLVVHGGLQAWWIEPVLKSFGELPLFLGATVLTAFNDNAAITYLATLVPGFTEPFKYAVVAGAVTGGGLTVIANAPNPAGQNILQRYFPEGVSPLGLVAAAVPPTAIMSACFLLF